MTTATVKPFDDLIDFLAMLAPKDVLAFKPSEATVRRVEWLISQAKEGKATPTETDELDRYLIQEDLMIIAKARARLRLAQS